MSDRVPPPTCPVQTAFPGPRVTLRVQIPEAVLAPAKAHYDHGRPLTALHLLQGYGPLGDWDGPEAGLFATRLTSVLGGARTAVARQLQLARRYPDHPEVALFGCFGIFAVRGPLEVLKRTGEFLRTHPDIDVAAQADFHALRGHAYGFLKDFERAEASIQLAHQTGMHRHWVLCEEATVAEYADDLDRGIALCQEALALHPRYRPAAERLIEWLLLKNRDDEARELIFDLGANTEWAEPAWTWQRWLSEQGQTGPALEALEAYEARSPLLDQGGRRRLAAARSSLLLEHGDFAGAAEWAEKADSPFHKLLSERGKETGTGNARYHRLPVGFVRQNDMTCAPATLTMLAQYWGLPADHLALANEVCYDGTPGWKQRQWLEQQGWVVREFSVTPESARALLDNGAPFAMATVEADSAHLQAVIGYDDRTGCLIIRDPNIRHHLYFPEKEFYEKYAAWGPRGTVFAPRSEAHRFMGLPLTDSSLHDLVYAFDHALESHRRTDAGALLTRMEQEAPNHRIVLYSRLRLRLYDGHPAALACVEELLTRYPEDQAFGVMKFRISAGEMPRAERLRYVREQTERPKAGAWWMLTLASLLGEDARCQAEADEVVRRLQRKHFPPAAMLGLMMTAADRRRDWERLLELRRFAACLSPRDESTASAWMETAEPLGRSQEVFSWLYNRWRRDGTKDAGPALTLARAVRNLHGPGGSLRTLEEALTLRPGDGMLMLNAVALYDETGAPDQAAAFLQNARGKVSDDNWHRAAARREALLGRPAEACIHWRSILSASPLDMEAHHTLCTLIGELEGPEAAARHVEQSRALHTSHLQLRHLHISMLRSQQNPRAIQVIEAALAADPLDAWCLRELALEYSRRNRADDAVAAARRATEIAPHHATSWNILGGMLAARQEKKAASEAFARGLSLDVDSPGVMSGLLETCKSSEHRRAVLDWMLQVMDAGFPSDSAVSEWADISKTHFSAGEHLQRLQDIRQRRPYLWQSHAQVIFRLSELGRHADATAVADHFCRFFPASPGTWIVAGEAFMRGGNPGRAIDLAKMRLAVTPNVSGLWHLLAAACDTAGRKPEALEALRTWHSKEPRNPSAALRYGSALWDSGKHREAWELVEVTIAADPLFEDGWSWLCARVEEAHRMDSFPARAAAIAAQHPHQIRILVEVARVHMTCGSPRAADETMVRALSLRPADLSFNLTRIGILMASGRVNDALRACRPSFFGKEIPMELILEEARILEENERPLEAITSLEELSTRFPNESRIWVQLTSVYHTKQQWSKEMDAAQRAVQLSPGDPVVHNTLGWIHLDRARDSTEKAQHIAAAEFSFRAALNLNATHAGALYGLIESQLRAGRLEEAIRLSDNPDPGLDPGVVALFQLIVAFRRNPDMLRPDAAANFIRSSDGVMDGGVYEVHRLACNAERSARLWKDLLEAAVRDGSIRHPALLRCWASMQGEDHAAIINALGCAPISDALRHTAWGQLCMQWLEAMRPQSILDGVARFPDKLRPGDRLWSAVIEQLNQTGFHEKIVQWTSDWRSRTNADAGSLAMAAASRVIVSGMHEAVPLWTAAIERASADETETADRVRGLRCDLAVTAAMAGKYDEASQLLAATPVLKDNDEWCLNRQFMRSLAEALIAAGRDRNASAAATHLRALNKVYPKWREQSYLQKVFPAVTAALQRLHPKAKLQSVVPFRAPKPKRIKAPRQRRGMNPQTMHALSSIGGTTLTVAVIVGVRMLLFKPAAIGTQSSENPSARQEELHRAIQKAQEARRDAAREPRHAPAPEPFRPRREKRVSP